MTDHINGIKMAVAAIAGALTGLWGWMGWLVVGWIICMVLDYITGSAAAATITTTIIPVLCQMPSRALAELQAPPLAAAAEPVM